MGASTSRRPIPEDREQTSGQRQHLVVLGFSCFLLSFVVFCLRLSLKWTRPERFFREADDFSNRVNTQSAYLTATFLSSIQKGRPHMNLASQLRDLAEQTRGLGTTERAVLCCRAAKQLEKAGEYDAAY